MDEEILKNASLNILYNDGVTLIELSKLESPASFLMIPYISMITSEGTKFLSENYKIENIEHIINESDIDNKKVRNTIKLFQSSFKKEISTLNNIDEIHHDQFAPRFSFFKRHIKYENLGIFINKQNKIVGNSFQQDLILNLSEVANSKREKKEQVFQYSIYLGSLVAHIVSLINPKYFIENDYSKIKKYLLIGKALILILMILMIFL